MSQGDRGLSGGTELLGKRLWEIKKESGRNSVFVLASRLGCRLLEV
jgi:hypothetical protein